MNLNWVKDTVDNFLFKRRWVTKDIPNIAV